MKSAVSLLPRIGSSPVSLPVSGGRALLFAEGVGAGAGVVLAVAALLLLTRARVVSSAARRIQETSRSGRSPLTGRPPADYLDLCRAAGL